MPTNRSTRTGGVWAEGSADPPAEPVQGTTYSLSTLLEATINSGWPFSEVVDSAAFNEMMKRITSLLILCETLGIMTWNVDTTYDTSALCMGSNGSVYKSKTDANTGNDPTADVVNWEVAFALPSDLSAHAALTNPHSATSVATANRLVLRDANKRFKAGAPSASDDVAIKDTVDAHANAAAPHTGHAAKAGNAAQTFSVATATSSYHALRLGMLAGTTGTITTLVIPMLVGGVKRDCRIYMGIAASAVQAIVFPLAYANEVLSIHITPPVPTATQSGATSVTLSGFTSNSDAANSFWMAIGW